MKIKIDQFFGIRPRQSSRLLDQREATNAVNCRFYNGKLQGWRGLSLVEEGVLTPNLIVTQVGVEVISSGTYLRVAQVGVEVVSTVVPALQVSQVGLEVISS